MQQQLQTFATDKVDPNLRDWLMHRLYYISGEFKDPKAYALFAQTLAEADKNHNTQGNYFFYLATSRDFRGDIVEQLGASALAKHADGYWRRRFFGKPFGNDR